MPVRASHPDKPAAIATTAATTAAADTATAHPPRRRLWLAPLAWIAICAMLTLVFAAQLVLATSLDWSRAVEISLTHWAMPFVVFFCGWLLTELLPLERGRLRWRLPAHLLASFVIATVAAPLEGMYLRPGMRNPDDRAPRPPPEFFRDSRHAPDAASFSGDRPARGRFSQMPPPQPSDARRPMPGGPMPRGGHLMFMASSRWQLALAIYWISVGLAHAWRLRRRMQERDRRAAELAASLSKAKLDALRLQLNPHFLFNSLNAIAALVHRSPQAAEDMIVNLSALLRVSLATTAREHTLRRELEILDHYLNMEQERLGARLRITRDIAPETLDAPVPSLLLQPVVENAVRHGIEPRSAPGTVSIGARHARGGLHIVIRNDGPPLPASDDARPAPRPPSGLGIGLSNTADRLREMYGARGRITFAREADGGARVEITLPFAEITAAATPPAGADFP